jgi:hypothetical protein
MNPIAASLIAMVVAWALPLVGMVIGQLATSGRTADVVATAFWVGAFALVGWAVAVLPFAVRFTRTKLFSDLRWSWLGWAILGTTTFAMLLIPIMGGDALQILWYPALMGCIAGITFSLLLRSSRAKNA